MTPDQAQRCRTLIHAHAAGAALGNAVPIPGVGVAADTVALTLLAMSLCAVFGGNLSETTAKALAIAAVKNSMVNQPIKLLSRELSRFVPLLGQLVAPALSLAMLEAAGWALARELEDRARGKAD